MSIQQNLHVAMVKARQEYDEAKTKYWKLIAACPHNIIGKGEVDKWTNGTAYCDICESHLGWYCPTSPTKLCKYPEPTGKSSDEWCVYCNLPIERK